MKTSSAKAKGRKLQKLIVDLLIAKLGVSENDVKSIPGGVQGEDIWLSEQARMLFPFSIEAKNQERLNIWGAIEQAETNSKGNTALVVFSKNRSPVYVCLAFSEFMLLYSRLLVLQKTLLEKV